MLRSLVGSEMCIRDSFLHKTHASLQQALSPLGWELRASDSEQGPTLTMITSSLQEESVSKMITKGEVQVLGMQVERRMEASMEDPEDRAEKLQAVAQAALEGCSQLVQDSNLLDGLGAGSELERFNMTPVMSWDPAAFGGSVSDVLGPLMLTAYTGFSASPTDAAVTMPCFKDWAPDSEFVGYILKYVPEEERSNARMWRYMYHMCLRAPCHEVIHLLQHVAGQRMTGQLAEHDGYFSSQILMTAVMTRTEGFGYPGCGEAILMQDCYKIIKITELVDSGWLEEDYVKWRDSFGVALGVWNDKDFGATGDHQGKGIEFKCGAMLTFEAGVGNAGSPVDEEDPERVMAVVDGMLHTMFGDRTANSPDGFVDEKSGRRMIDCNGRPVKIAEVVSLAGMSLGDRLGAVSAPIGLEASRSRFQEFTKSCSELEARE
eukprot:TRINITY_DN11180_c0_g1_i2.p1 TRINITY_DN11180_c0_g1~~TRINITY_DN11180_c0_g1_i2.p1  ORF type:complete len:470 (-),score=148.79 TRINITY_DN11180_c0_g1_i2:276-1574(-)